MKNTLRIEGGGYHRTNKYRKKVITDHIAKSHGRPKKSRVDWEQQDIDDARAYAEYNKKRRKDRRRDGIVAQREEYDLYLWRLKQNPSYRLGQSVDAYGSKIFLHCLDDYRKLFLDDFKHMSEELKKKYNLEISSSKISRACRSKACLRIDHMLKLCHYLMIPSIEYAYNLWNAPPNYYEGNVRVLPKMLQADMKELHLTESWETYCVGRVHTDIVNRYGKVLADSLKQKIFVQNLRLSKAEQCELLDYRLLSRQYLWRLLHNKRIPKSDMCFKIVLLLNRRMKTNYRVHDFWHWVEDTAEYTYKPRPHYVGGILPELEKVKEEK